MVITCRLISGFGNNLYQIAATYSISKKNGEDFNLIAPKENGRFQEIRDFGGHYTPMHPDLPRNVQEIFPYLPWIDYKRKDDTIISSYLFDYDIIEPDVESFSDLLTPHPSIEEYISKKYPMFDMGIHLRYKGGSDSFAPESNNEGWLLDIISKEVSKHCETSESPYTIVITSNRAKLANDLINTWKNTFGMKATFTLLESEPVFIDCFVLSKCKTLICSNSTFSFWSGLIGAKKTVYISPEYKPAMCLNAIPPHWNTNREVFYNTSIEYRGKK